jgi:hypothetical protein
VKKWQTTFFYVKNVDPARDLINLPAFSLAAPTGKQNWGHQPRTNDPAAEVNRLMEYPRSCVTRYRVSPADLMAAFISRRVLLLQRWVHKMCYMSGRLDPTRTSKVQLSKLAIARRVNFVSQAHLPENWDWGMEPFSREDPPPLVSCLVRRLPVIACPLFFLSSSPRFALCVPASGLPSHGGGGRRHGDEGVGGGPPLLRG